MKNRALEWIIATTTAALLALGGLVASSFASRLTSAGDMINRVEEKRQANETDIAVMKEVLGQVNSRTYEMDAKLDKIRDLIRK